MGQSGREPSSPSYPPSLHYSPTLLPPLSLPPPRSLPASALLWGLCRPPPSLHGGSDPDLSHDTFDRSHSNHPTGPTVQLGHGSCRQSVEPLAQASPTPPGALSGRCEFYASSPPAKAESSSLAFGTGLLPRDTPHPAPRLSPARRSFPWLPASYMSQADSDLHWLVSWFHQRT